MLPKELHQIVSEDFPSNVMRMMMVVMVVMVSIPMFLQLSFDSELKKKRKQLHCLPRSRSMKPKANPFEGLKRIWFSTWNQLLVLSPLSNPFKHINMKENLKFNMDVHKRV
jgi:hypothetical protein